MEKQKQIPEEVIDMTEPAEILVGWNDVKSESLYMNTDDFKTRASITVKNVRIVKVVKKAYKSDEVKEMLELRMDVIKMNNKDVDKRIWSNSMRLIEAIRMQLENLKVAPAEVQSKVFSFKIKKIGEEKSVNYDIEEFEVRA